MSKKEHKKILIVHCHYREPGGEESYVANLSNLLKQSGYRVSLFKKDNRTINSLSLVRIGLNLFFGKRTQAELSKALQQDKPDLVHFNNLYPLIGPWAYRVCHRRKIPVVQTVHSLRFFFPWTYPGNIITGFIYCLAVFWHRLMGNFNLVDLFIFPSEFARSYYIKHGHIPRSKTVVIPNFVNKGLKKKKASGFLFVGRLSREKGLDLLLKSFPHEQGLSLTVVGGIKKRHDKTVFLGRLPKAGVYRQIVKAQFVVVPSRVKEVLPTVVLEAFANSTPVIAPKSGVFRNMIKDGKTGLFFKWGEETSLRRVIIAASRITAAKYKAMCRAAYREYQQSYTQEAYLKNLRVGYNKLTDEK